MRIVHLTGKDFFGAGRAAYRLHKGLQSIGVDSILLVGNKASSDKTVVELHGSAVHKWMRKILVKLEKLYLGAVKPGVMFSSGRYGFQLVNKVNQLQPDIVHVHWINRGFMNLSSLLHFKVPVVVSMHDMWYFTGGCHTDQGCGKFQSGCDRCPLLVENKSALPPRLLMQKEATYSGVKNLHFIGLSRWMASAAAQSVAMQEQHIFSFQLQNSYRMIEHNK